MSPPRSRTLGELLFEQADRHGAHPAVICDDRTVGYAALAERARRIAGALQARGIGRGDRVGLLMNNRLEWVETFLGAAILGAVVVAFSTWSKPDELDYLFADSAIKLLVTLDRFAGQDFAADLADMTAGSRYPALREIVLLGEGGAPHWTRYDALLAARPLPQPLPPGDGASAVDEAVVIYTSGSSSRPKSVPLAHYGIIENGFNIGERQGYTPEDRVLLAPPLFWSYGSANAMSAVLTHGATLVLQGRFEPGEALALIERHRCTALYTLPAITSALVSHPSFRRHRTASLRTGLTIGAPQDVVTAAEVLGATEICNVYGQTESYGNCCVTWHHWPLERRAACQGPPLPGVTIRIVDADSDAELPPGRAGLIEVRGYVMRGYIGASASQNEAALTADGFFRTGDMGLLTEAGEMQFIGRTTEMIKKGGINISPAEVEDMLMRHPGVAQAGVVGVPDPLQGELLAAFVVPAPGAAVTAEALADHCRAVASRYKVPDFIVLRDTLPVTVTGKLMRRELKPLAASLLARRG
jgi:fatty-acyl-CoA synthase